MRSLKNWSESSCKIWILEHKKIKLNSKDEPSTSKIERVTGFFVSRLEAKSQFCQFFKSQNFIQFLRFGANFLDVRSISRGLTSNHLGVLHHSFIDFVKNQPLPDPGFEGVKGGWRTQWVQFLNINQEVIGYTGKLLIFSQTYWILLEI